MFTNWSVLNQKCDRASTNKALAIAFAPELALFVAFVRFTQRNPSRSVQRPPADLWHLEPRLFLHE